jgi:hypothetical protein
VGADTALAAGRAGSCAAVVVSEPVYGSLKVLWSCLCVLMIG